MAQPRAIEIIDDLDGTSDATPREFSVGGVSYDIDLSDENYENLISGLSDYIAAARRTKSSSHRGQQGPKASREDLHKDPRMGKLQWSSGLITRPGTSARPLRLRSSNRLTLRVAGIGSAFNTKPAASTTTTSNHQTAVRSTPVGYCESDGELLRRYNAISMRF